MPSLSAAGASNFTGEMAEIAAANVTDAGGQPVLGRITSRYPATIKLALAAMLIATLVSIPLGVTAATHRGSFIDTLSTLIALLGISLPSFALGPDRASAGAGPSSAGQP